MKLSSLLSLVIFTLSAAASNSFAADSSANTTPNNTMNMNTQNQQNDPINMIMQDHAKIRGMIAQLEKSLGTNVAQSRAYFNQLKDFLVKHETMEQQAWYPALSQYKGLTDIINELKKEETEASDKIAKLDKMTDDQTWMKEVKQFNKDVDHHAKDEETKLFPKVKKEVNVTALQQIGKQLQDYRNKNQMN